MANSSPADMLHVQAQPKSATTGSGDIQGNWPIRTARRHPGKSHRRRGLRPGFAVARHGARPLVRPPSYGAQLTECDTSVVEKLPGVVKVVRDGNFLAVVAEKEFQSIKAMNALAAAAKWKVAANLPKQDDLFKVLTSLPSQDTTIFERSNPAIAGQKTIEATYTRPYQAHGSIGPSCAVAQLIDGAMTVWTHTQGVYPDRQGIAEICACPDDRDRRLAYASIPSSHRQSIAPRRRRPDRSMRLIGPRIIPPQWSARLRPRDCSAQKWS